MADLTVKSKFFAMEDKLEVNANELKEVAEVPSTEDITAIANSAIQADKDILSKIEYDDEQEFVAFPDGIIPLRITIEQELYPDKPYYFDYSTAGIVDEENETTGVDAYFDGQNYVLENTSSLAVHFRITSLVYILVSGNAYLNYEGFDTYYLFNPITSAGTKLYRHRLYFGQGYPQYTLYILNFDSTPITKETFQSLKLTDTISIYCEGFLVTQKDGGSFIARYFNGSGTFVAVDLTSIPMFQTDEVIPL